jgi:hypothetical protein
MHVVINWKKSCPFDMFIEAYRYIYNIYMYTFTKKKVFTLFKYVCYLANTAFFEATAL